MSKTGRNRKQKKRVKEFDAEVQRRIQTLRTFAPSTLAVNVKKAITWRYT